MLSLKEGGSLMVLGASGKCESKGKYVSPACKYVEVSDSYENGV